MAEVKDLTDGTGGCWTLDALAEATRSLEVAKANGAETWSHLLVEAMARVMVETDNGALFDRLTELQIVTEYWRETIINRTGTERK